MGKPDATSLRSDRRILAVDDNPAVLKLLGELFADEGITVRLAQSAAQAKKRLETPGETFDLVLSDIQMPGESGFDLLQWIKRDGSPHRGLPVLLTTAQLPEADNRLKGLAMGAVDYVVRPIEMKELVLRAINAIDHFQRVRALETSLQDSESQAMAGRLMAASNHEIKNLATLVKLCTEQLQRSLGTGLSPGSTTAVSLKSLAESSALLVDVARHVGSLFDPNAMVLKPVHLAELVTAVLPLVHPRVHPIRLEFARERGEAVWALSHDIRVKQVLINLILNAADAIGELDPPSGGRISVRITAAGDEARLAVVDNGIGLSVAGVKTDFQPFATTKKLRGGQGLGLWLCARLVSNMRGTLSLQSDGVGRGATATIALPASAPSEPHDLDLEVQKYLAELEP